MKFTSYKYWLNEKFAEESDPIKDMGIGFLYKHRTFNTRKELHEFLYEIIPSLLNVKDPEDIINEDIDLDAYLVPKYFEMLKAYLNKYVTLKEPGMGLFYPGALKIFILNKKGKI